MGKLKTRHSAKKRFRRTVSGKFVRRRAFKGHLLEKNRLKEKEVYLNIWWFFLGIR